MKTTSEKYTYLKQGKKFKFTSATDTIELTPQISSPNFAHFCKNNKTIGVNVFKDEDGVFVSNDSVLKEVKETSPCAFMEFESEAI